MVGWSTGLKSVNGCGIDCFFLHNIIKARKSMEDHQLQKVWEESEIYEVRKIDSGSYGEVYQAYDQLNNRIIALKHVKGKFWQQEVQALKKLKHPSIIQYFGHVPEQSIKGQEHKHGAYIMTEFVDGGSLREVLSQKSVAKYGLPEYIVMKLFKQLVHGFSYMHQKGFVHRDIKPENILIYDEQYAKIIDLGQSKERRLMETLNQGTPIYNPPEVLSGENPKDFRRDSWSLGMVLYEMLTGEQLYEEFIEEHQNDYQIEKNLKRFVLEGKIKVRLNKKYDSFWKTLLDMMLEKNYKKRKYMHEIKLLFDSEYDSLERRLQSKLQLKNVRAIQQPKMTLFATQKANPLLATTNHTCLGSLRKYLKFYQEKHRFLIILSELLSLKKYPCRYPFLPRLHKAMVIFLITEIYLSSVRKIISDLKHDMVKPSPQQKYKLTSFQEPYRTEFQKQVSIYKEFFNQELKIFESKLQQSILPALRKCSESEIHPIIVTKSSSVESLRKTRASSGHKRSQSLAKITQTAKDITIESEKPKLLQQFPILGKLLFSYQTRTKMKREQYLQIFKELVESPDFCQDYKDLESYFYVGDLVIFYLMKKMTRLDEAYRWVDAKRGSYEIQIDYDNIQTLEHINRREIFLQRIKQQLEYCSRASRPHPD